MADYCNYSPSVRSHNLKTVRPNLTNSLCMLPMAVARSSSDGVAICYVVPVLRMTPCFHTMHETYTRTDGHGVVYCSGSPLPLAEHRPFWV